MDLVYLIISDCLLILIGWLLHNKWHFSGEFFTGLEKLVYFLLFPALMIRSLTLSPISLSSAGNLLIISFLLSFAGLWMGSQVKRFFPVEAKSLASSIQCAYRFNTFMGLSLASAIAGKESFLVMTVLVGFCVPIMNVLAVNTLAKHQNNSNVLLEILKNPLVISTFIGLTLNFSGWSIPDPFAGTLEKLSQGTISLGLMCVGAALMLRSGAQNIQLLSWIVCVRLLVMPIVGIVLALLFQLSAVSAQTLVLFTSLPTASAAYILAVRMGGDGRTVASIISVGTMFAMLTMPMWMSLAAWLFPLGQ
ncbi:AEC family transporter [Pelistega europaea]|uniref:AEC family transporter n=1 Tax=Pelistega europaea TaxID=106147 RepID=A0A7Y4L8A4_9BURK|nr:AEC family transporter [Pelistega europaea]NOL48789.1 AEC family transporter [Pelistega europaea]